MGHKDDCKTKDVRTWFRVKYEEGQPPRAVCSECGGTMPITIEAPACVHRVINIRIPTDDSEPWIECAGCGERLLDWKISRRGGGPWVVSMEAHR